LEGHPDNVGAALHGGFVICDGLDVRAVPVPDDLEAVLVVSCEPVRTSAARAALPEQVPIADAVANVVSAATLTLGLATSDWDLISAGLRDRLHQPYRAHLYPRSAALLATAASLGALGATISGAGPTVLVWCRADQTGPVMHALAPECEGWAEMLRVPFTADGLEVSSLG
jgi:homoserine kinase